MAVLCELRRMGKRAKCIKSRRGSTLNTTQPCHDSIVDEIHATRERLAEQYQNDLLAYSQAAESHCRALGFQIVESPRRLLVHENPQQVEVAAQQTVPVP